MSHFTGFGYKFDTFIDDFLVGATSTSSRTDCFDVLSGCSGYWIDKESKKVALSRRLSGENRWQPKEQVELFKYAYDTILSGFDIENPEVIRINLLKLQKEFECGLSVNQKTMQGRDIEYSYACRINETLKLLSTGVQQDGLIACKKLYAFALYAVLHYFVSNGTEAADIPDEIIELVDHAVNQTDAIKNNDFSNTVLTISEATYPDKTGTNTSDKAILFTRYALFALIKKEFPGEEALLRLLGDDRICAEELTSACKTAETSSDELKALFKHIDFTPHYNVYNGKKKPTGMILVNITRKHEEKTNEQYRKALESLLTAYKDLPKEFHENVKSRLKREINFTVSELVVSVAYKGVFASSEYDRATLLEICDVLVKTHNHNNKFLFALIEKSRDDEYLFKKYDKEDHECKRAIEIFDNFFTDNWRTEQSATIIGTKFLIWCDDTDVIFNLINGCCYDQKIWIEFASKYKGAATLRSIIQKKLFKNCNIKRSDFLYHTISFCQMATKENFKFLIFNAFDEQYNVNANKFIKYVIENLSSFPKDKHKLVNHGIRWMLISCNGYDPYYQYAVAKQLLEEVDIDWNSDIYSELRAFKEKIYNNKSGATEYPAIEAFLQDMADLEQDISNAPLMQRAALELRSLLLDSRVIMGGELAIAVQKLIEMLLEQENQFITILATADRLSVFGEETVARIFEYTKRFLTNCDFAHQENTNVLRALRILEYNGYIGAEEALCRCYAKLSEIKDCKAIELLIYLLKGLSTDKILSLLRDEKNTENAVFSQATEWLLKDNRHQLTERLNLNIVFEFMDALIDARNDNQINQALAMSVLHFSKKQDCFANKVPSSDEFYSEILLEANDVKICSKWLKNKAKKHNLSYNTALFHLCNILKNEPWRTAYICIEGLSKFYGNTEYLYFNQKNTDIKETYLFQKRREIFSLLISNPVIRSTAKFYCWNLRRYASVLPTAITELIVDVLNNGKYPDWMCEVTLDEIDVLESREVWASKLIYEQNDHPEKSNLTLEIQEKFIPFLQNADYSAESPQAYTSKSLIVAIKDGEFYHVVDGNHAVSKLIEESKIFGDFKINIVTIEI